MSFIGTDNPVGIKINRHDIGTQPMRGQGEQSAAAAQVQKPLSTQGIRVLLRVLRADRLIDLVFAQRSDKRLPILSERKSIFLAHR